MFQKNDNCWIIRNNSRIEKVNILAVNGNLYTIHLETGATIRLQKHRLFNSYEEAKKALTNVTNKRKQYSNPYKYLH